MGVEYKYLLIPRDNTHRPDIEAVKRLIAAWRDSSFALRPGSPEQVAVHQTISAKTQVHAVATGASLHTASGWRSFDDGDIGDVAAGELILQWPVPRAQPSQVRNPFGLVDEEDGTYFDLELHFSEDFVQVGGEMIDPMDARCSRCGEDLEYWTDMAVADIFYASRIRRVCPACQTAFRPQDRVVTYRDGMTGAERDLTGGATYRFAIVIDCGKCWRTEDSGDVEPTLSAEFFSVCSEALGIPLYGVGYFD